MLNKNRLAKMLSLSALIADVKQLHGDLEFLMIHGIHQLSDPDSDGTLHVIGSDSIQVTASGFSLSARFGESFRTLNTGDSISVQDIAVFKESADLFVYGNEDVKHVMNEDFFRVLEFLGYLVLDQEV